MKPSPSPPDEQYAIADLERLSGIKAHTLRAWEKRYNFIVPQRTATNIRFYTRADLRRVLNVAMLVHQGERISDLATLSPEALHIRVLSLDPHTGDQESGITGLVSAMIEYDEPAFHFQFDALQARFGIERAMVEVLYPFLERIGVLWMTGHINPAQEHFVSHLVRQKMIAGIESLPRTEDLNAPSFLLYLPDGELHELSLLFSYLMIKRRGGRVIYLGQSVPAEDVVAVVNQRNPDHVLTHLTAPQDPALQAERLTKVAQHIAPRHLYVSGRAAQEPRWTASNIIAIGSLGDFRTRLSALIPRSSEAN